MAKDLLEIDLEHKQGLLLKAIQQGNRPAIVKLLKEIPDQITPEIVKKIAEFLDPDSRKVHKTGPKPKKRTSFIHRNSVIGFYKYLCEDPEVDRSLKNNDDDEQYSLKNREEIKALVCKMYGIGSRVFDDWLAEYNKK